MVGVSEFLGEKEIIFPEIAAISIGGLLAPELSWKVTYLRMIVFVTLCAVLGVAMVLLCSLPLFVEIVLAYIVGQLLFLYSGTSFAPMISAIVLPVLMQTKSVIYILSAFALTTVIVLIRILLEKRGILPNNKGEMTKRPQKPDFIRLIGRTFVCLALAYICISHDIRFCVAPPLLVAFTELSTPGCKASKCKAKVVALVTLCAFSGAFLRFFLSEKLPLPLTLTAVIVAITIIVLVKAFKLYFPPAGAMAVLAMMIPASELLLYPLQVAGAITTLVLIATFLSNEL